MELSVSHYLLARGLESVALSERDISVVNTSDADIAALNIPTGNPLRYDLDENLKPLTPGGTYLDPEAAAAGAAASSPHITLLLKA